MPLSRKLIRQVVKQYNTTNKSGLYKAEVDALAGLLFDMLPTKNLLKQLIQEEVDKTSIATQEEKDALTLKLARVVHNHLLDVSESP